MEIVANIMHLRSQPKDTHKKIQHSEKARRPALYEPLRISARQANELVCVVKIMEDKEGIEYINEDKVDQDCTRKESHNDKQVKLKTNIITDIEKWLEQPWSASE